MNIVLTASFKNGLFSNGLTQNIVFLAELINDIGYNAIICINHALEEGKDVPQDLDLIYEKDLYELENVTAILETGWTLQYEDVKSLKKNSPSAKHVHIHYGNRMMSDIERCRSGDAIGISREPVDEVWLSPHYEESIPYFKTFYKNPNVFTLPYIWSPKYIDFHTEIFEKANKSPYYKPGNLYTFSILEPNLNMTKNCIPSVIIIEEVLQRGAIDFDKLIVYCSHVIAEKKYFMYFINQLDLFRKQKISFAGRENLVEIFARQANACISHQLMNGLNYTYLEALYFGVPLIHNSTYIEDAGFYYPGYDTHKGADQVEKMITTYDRDYEEHMKKNKEVLFRYSPKNEMVKMMYKRMIEA